MFINLHAHTNYSDGCSSIATYAEVAKRCNHVCLVITDHDYMMTRDTYRQQLAEAELMSKEYGIAIICGLEISLWYEEALLFNKEACLDWLDRRERFVIQSEQGLSKFDYLACYIKEITQKYDCALILVHPHIHPEHSKSLFDNGIIQLFNGYEIRNGRYDWPLDKIEYMECIMPKAKQYKNYDCHHDLDFSQLTNETDEYIGTEQELIKWIKGETND